jgi:5'-3' exonuclease
MGVPGFFAWLLKQDKHNKILKRRLFLSPHTLFFDANCLFHPQCFKILKAFPYELSVDKLESMMMERIINYIKFIIEYAAPSELVYIAVDGVAPLAKINQQRKRRYKSVEENEMKNSIYKKYSIPNNTSWSNIVITPGTEFMKKLDKKLREFINVYKSPTSKQLKFVYSSYEERGEGEHKILQYLKENYTNNTEKTHIIYGLDADLIFLALASNMSNIYLLREQSNFGKTPQIEEKDPIKDVTELMTYVSILESRNTFNFYFKSRLDLDTIYTENKEVVNIDFINDFIFLCYFLGNDFLPHIPSINIRKEGLETVIEAYLYAYERTGELMILKTNPDIEYSFLTIKLFLSYLADIEKTYFKEQYNKLTRKNFSNPHVKPYEKELQDLDNLVHIKKEDDPFNLLSPYVEMETAKSQYYQHHFNMRFNLKNQIKNITKSYYKVLKWVGEYYFHKAPSWNVQYDYDEAPFISDIYENFKQFEKIKIEKDTVSLTIPQQLLSVIPPAKSDILDKSIRIKMKNLNIIHMLPKKVEYDYNYKDKFWLCEAIMPYLDYEEIIKIK